MIRDSETTQRSHVGRIAFGPDPRPVGAFAEQQLWDVWLALPVPVSIFANGFEP